MKVMPNLWSETAQGFLKDWSLSKTSRKTYASNSHEIREVSWILPKCIWCDLLPSLLLTDSACSPVTTLQISHPFRMVPLRTPAGFHQLLTGEIVFACFISPNRGKVLRLSKAGYAKNHLNSVIKRSATILKSKHGGINSWLLSDWYF